MLETLLRPDDTEERCGLILRGDKVVELSNVAEDRENTYRMDPAEVLKHLDETIGTWHTHPSSDPNLSGEDYAGFLAWPDLRHFIIGRRQGKVVVEAFQIKEGLVIGCE